MRGARGNEVGGIIMPLAVVFTATLTVATAPFTVNPLGAVQVASTGAPAQLIVTFPAKPDIGETLSE